MRRSTTGCTVLVLAALATWASLSARAGTRRHDRTDVQHVDLAVPFENVGKFTLFGDMVGSGTLIGENWVLSAAHVTEEDPALSMDFELGVASYQPAEVIYHPDRVYAAGAGGGYDIALVRLKTLVMDVEPATRYRETGEVGLLGTMVGFGQTGTGLTGHVEGTSGTKRAGHNMIDTLGPDEGYSDQYMGYDFDRPGDASESTLGDATPLQYEYLPAPGDSGGAVFVDVEGSPQLAGVISFTVTVRPMDWWADSDYGDQGFSTRVSQFNEWIDDVVTQPGIVRWKEATGGIFSDNRRWRSVSVPPTDRVPGTYDTAMFDQQGLYTVRLTQSLTNDRLLIHNGHVTLDLDGHTYTLRHTGDDGSVAVGFGAMPLTLNIDDGTVSGGSGMIGDAPGSNGHIRLFPGAARWENTGTVTVGKAGRARLDILSGAYLSAAELRVGHAFGGVGDVSMSGAAADVAADAEQIGWQGTGTFIQTAGTHTIATQLVLGETMHGRGTYTLGGGSLLVPTLRVAGEGFGTFEWTGGTLDTGAVEIGPRGTMTVGAGVGKALLLGSLAIDPGGTMDLAGNTLVVEYAGGPSPFDTILAYVTTGSAGGSWDGVGIRSSAAAADQQDLTALGIIDDGEKVTVDYTWYGDANLDGVVDSNDYDKIDTAWTLWTKEGLVPEGGFRWFVGDFDYDGTIDSNDYDCIDNAWLLSEGGPAGGGNPPAPTPEPATLTLVALGLVAAALRRRPR